MDQLDIAIHQTAHDAPGGIQMLAQAIGKGHQVLINKCNPNNDSNVLTLREAIAMMQYTSDLRILEAAAQMLGCVVERKASPAAKSISAALISAYAHEGDVTRLIQDAINDGKLTIREKAKIRDEIAGTIDALDRLRATVAASPTILSQA